LLDVLLTKMVADWFAGREIVTAMAILVSSWPLGISLALVSLGPLAAVSSWRLVMHLAAAVCVVALALVAVIYRTPSTVDKEPTSGWSGLKLSRRELGFVALAALIWALFNGGFSSLPSFAPGFLISIGYTTAAAGSLVSVVTWIVIPAVQLGGYVAERLRRPNLIMATCFAGIGLAMVLLPYWEHRMALCVALGLLFGPPCGNIMALPIEALRPENRAPGMGVFYTCTCGGAMALSALAGLSRDLTHNPAAPLLFGGSLLFVTVIVLGLFRALQTRSAGRLSVQND
jgi:MFS family permease